MGSEATKALQARRLTVATRVDRLVREAERRSPASVTKRKRIQIATRLGRRRLRAIGPAQAALTALEAGVGDVILAMGQEGISRNGAYESLGLTRAVGRRYVALAESTRGHSTKFSTAKAGAGAGERRAAEHRNQEPQSGPATERRNP